MSDELKEVEEGAESTEMTPEQVLGLYTAIDKQNTELINRLGIIGRSLNPLVLVRLQIEVLIDFIFENEEARQQYDTATALRLNEILKGELAKAVGA